MYQRNAIVKRYPEILTVIYIEVENGIVVQSVGFVVVPYYLEIVEIDSINTIFDGSYD